MKIVSLALGLSLIGFTALFTSQSAFAYMHCYTEKEGKNGYGQQTSTYFCHDGSIFRVGVVGDRLNYTVYDACEKSCGALSE